MTRNGNGQNESQWPLIDPGAVALINTHSVSQSILDAKKVTEVTGVTARHFAISLDAGSVLLLHPALCVPPEENWQTVQEKRQANLLPEKPFKEAATNLLEVACNAVKKYLKSPRHSEPTRKTAAPPASKPQLRIVK